MIKELPIPTGDNDDAFRNANMIRLAHFQQDMREQTVTLAKIIAETPDLIDTQTVCDTIAAALDNLGDQYHAALRKRDGLRVGQS